MRRCVVFSTMFLLARGHWQPLVESGPASTAGAIEDPNLAERGVAYRNERNSQRRTLTAP